MAARSELKEISHRKMHLSGKSQATTTIGIVGFIPLDAALRIDEDSAIGSEVVEDHALVTVPLSLIPVQPFRTRCAMCRYYNEGLRLAL